MEFIITSEILVAVLLSVILVVVVLFITIKKLLRDNNTLTDALAIKQSKAAMIGRNTALGDIHQFIGDFAILSEYDELILLSTTSRQASLDVIGVKENRMDFIELKKKGARISTSENKIRRIIENKNVRYVVKDVEIPAGVSVVERQLPELRG